MASAGELLREAAQGRLGVDRRLIQSILESGPEAAQEVLAFARGPRDSDRIDLDPLLVDLFRHWQTPEALDILIEAVRRTHEDVNDELVQALLPFGERAVEPLLKLYEELGEEQGSDIAFLLAGLGVRDPRVLALLLDRLQFDAGRRRSVPGAVSRSGRAARARNHARRDSRGGSRTAARSPARPGRAGRARAFVRANTI